MGPELLRVTELSALIWSGFVIELVTRNFKLQNLGALDKEKDPQFPAGLFYCNSVVHQYDVNKY